MLRFRKREEDSNILLEIFYDKTNTSVNDVLKITHNLEKIKGIITIKVTNTHKDYIPDIIAFANWNEKEIEERLKDIYQIPAIININHKKLIKI